MRKDEQYAEWLKSFLSSERILALFASLMALAILLTSLAAQPELYPADYGQYEQYMRQYGLSAFPADGEADASATASYAYKRFSVMKLFSPSAGYTTAYAVAVVRLLTHPFGLPFSGSMLAGVWIAALAFAIYLLTYHLLRLLPFGGWIPAVILCLVFSDGNFIAMLRGLYPQGGAVVMLLLYAGVLALYLDRIRNRRGISLIPLALVSLLLIKSAPGMLVLLPGAAAAFVWVCRRERKQGFVSLARLAVAVVLLVTGAVGTVRLAAEDTDLFSDAAVYESAFHVLLPRAEEPEKVLEAWGLDESYLADAGKTYYQDPDTFAHPPTDEKEAEALFSRLNAGKILASYFRSPSVLLRAVEDIPGRSDAYINDRNTALRPTGAGYTERRAETGPMAAVRLALPWEWTVFAVFMLTGALAAFLYAGIKKRGGWAVLGIGLLCAVLYLPVCVILNGYSLSSEYMLCHVFMQDMLFIAVLIALDGAVHALRKWMTRYSASPFTDEWAVAAETVLPASILKERAARARTFLSAICADRRATVAAVATLAVLMACFTLLRPDHAACVNNGDFDRMMSSIDLAWTAEAQSISEGTSLHWVIEEYDWTAGFDWQRLTPLKASYSLYFFASVSRLLTDLAGQPMNTYVLEWVMTLFAIAAILLLVWDLYPRFRAVTLPFGALLCAILLSETNLSWYNGLFGEGCVMLGLLLSCACAVHLAVMPRTGVWKRILWLALLSYSLYILTTSKAQMLLALPFAILLLIALVIYHWPRRFAWRSAMALCLTFVIAFVSLGAYREYVQERNQDSGAQMHTMWQAYFYGIFMIADDPIQEMEALGIDTAMAADIGKYVDFSEDAQYVYHPLSDEAKEKFTDHVSTVKIVLWYITHPAKMIYMLNHAADVARQTYTGFRAYKSQDYWDWAARDTVDGLGLWMYWREKMVPSTFLGYFLFYLIYVIWIIRRLFSRKKPATREEKALCAILLFILLTGVLQYPLSVLGNGFADNQKQLFCFTLCHDLLLMLALVRFFQWVGGQSLDTLRTRLKTLRRIKKPRFHNEPENGVLS